MSKKILGLTFVAGGLALSTGAQATVITDSFSNTQQTTEIAQTGVLDLFDTNLGTLNSVILTLAGQSISSTTLQNTSTGDQTFSYDSTLDFVFSITGIDIPDPTFTTTLATTDGRVNLGEGLLLDLGETEDDGSLELTFSGGDLASFIGTGEFNVGCETFTSSTMSGGGGNIETVQSTTAACASDIAYDFTEVDQPPPPPPPAGIPEPTTLALIGLGLFGLGYRHRKSQS